MHTTVYDRLLASCCPSICLSVTLCIVALKAVYMAKSCTSVLLAGKFLFLPSDTFAAVSVAKSILQPQNAQTNESRKKTRT